MANPEIPIPLSNGTTDVASGPPPVPAGFSDAPPVPSGFSDMPPQATPAKPASEPGPLERIGNDIKQTVSQTGDLITGGGKALGETITGLGRLMNKVPVVGEYLAPKEGLKAEEKTVGKPEGTAQWVGYGGENLAEFLLGDEALKGLSMAEKFSQIGKVTEILEKSPRLMKMLQLGTDVGKAAGELGPEEQAALKKSPLLARLVGEGMTAVRQGAVAGAQKTAKTGSPTEGAKEAVTQGAVSGVLGSAFGVLGRVTEKAGEAGKAVKEASEVGAAADTKKQITDTLANTVQDQESQMHKDFETGIQNLKGKLGGKTIEFQGSPLQKAASEAVEGKAEQIGTLGKEFKGVAGGSDTTKKLLLDLTEEGKSGPLSIDELVQRRQQLGEKIGQITRGATSSADRADVAIYQKLRDGIDQTIEQLSKESGSPEASKDYAAIRQAYKDKVNLFKEPVIKSLLDTGTDSATSLDNAAKTLMAGKNKIDKIATLEKVIGPDGVKQFGQHYVQTVLNDASKGGQINPDTFVKKWKEIDSLPPEVKSRLFGTVDQNMLKGLQSAANYQKLVRAGVISGAGAGVFHSGLGLALGLLSETGAADKANGLLDIVANNPRMWSAFRTAGKVGAVAEKSPAARVAASAVKRGAGSALSNVLQGANQPLSSPEENQ